MKDEEEIYRAGNRTESPAAARELAASLVGQNGYCRIWEDTKRAIFAAWNDFTKD